MFADPTNVGNHYMVATMEMVASLAKQTANDIVQDKGMTFNYDNKIYDGV